jgi:hypothetical protein
MEVMYTQSGPCLVEVGSRCQGGEGTWLPIVEECIGYSQVSVTLDAYLGGELFRRIPKDSYELRKAGRDVDVVSRHAGVVRSLKGDAMIRKLPSFRNISWEVHVGDFCPLTIDCFTRPACVQLVHESEEQVVYLPISLSIYIWLYELCVRVCVCRRTVTSSGCTSWSNWGSLTTR